MGNISIELRNSSQTVLHKAKKLTTNNNYHQNLLVLLSVRSFRLLTQRRYGGKIDKDSVEMLQNALIVDDRDSRAGRLF
jgi:hypothetical protein